MGTSLSGLIVLWGLAYYLGLQADRLLEGRPTLFRQLLALVLMLLAMALWVVGGWVGLGYIEL